MKPLACAQCGLLRAPVVTRQDINRPCSRCGNAGPLARLSATQRADVWERYKAMKEAQVVKHLDIPLDIKPPAPRLGAS